MRKIKPTLIKNTNLTGQKRRPGQASLLRSIEVGGSTRVKPERISTPQNLHTIANRLGMKVAVRKVTSGKQAGHFEVFRLK